MFSLIEVFRVWNVLYSYFLFEYHFLGLCHNVPIKFLKIYKWNTVNMFFPLLGKSLASCGVRWKYVYSKMYYVHSYQLFPSRAQVKLIGNRCIYISICVNVNLNMYNEHTFKHVYILCPHSEQPPSTHTQTYLHSFVYFCFLNVNFFSA